MASVGSRLTDAIPKGEIEHGYDLGLPFGTPVMLAISTRPRLRVSLDGTMVGVSSDAPTPVNDSSHH